MRVCACVCACVRVCLCLYMGVCYDMLLYILQGGNFCTACWGCDQGRFLHPLRNQRRFFPGRISCCISVSTSIYLFLHLYICLVSMYFPMGSKMCSASSLRSGAIIVRAHLHIHLNQFLCIYICLLSMYFPVRICVRIRVKNKRVISVSSIFICVSIYSLISPTYSFPCPRLPPPLPNSFLHLLQLVCQRVPSSQILHILK